MRFTLENYKPGDKRLTISGPYGLRMWVDFDDVDTTLVREQATAIVDILNNSWLEAEC